MNEISRVALISDDADVFMQEAREHLMSLGYEIGTPYLTCTFWKNATEWTFKPSLWNSGNLPDTKGASLHECITNAREWLQTLRSENEILEAVLGFKP